MGYNPNITVSPHALSMKEIHARRKELFQTNKKFGPVPVRVPPEAWPKTLGSLRKAPIEVWRNSDFLIQIFEEGNGVKRLSICRTQIKDDGHFADDATWEELQFLKNACGFRDLDAVEIYPAEVDAVRCCNLRHLWVFPKLLGFAWRAKPTTQPTQDDGLRKTPASGD